MKLICLSEVKIVSMLIKIIEYTLQILLIQIQFLIIWKDDKLR